MKRFLSSLFGKLFNKDQTLSQPKISTPDERIDQFTRRSEIISSLPPSPAGWFHLRLRRAIQTPDDPHRQLTPSSPPHKEVHEKRGTAVSISPSSTDSPTEPAVSQPTRSPDKREKPPRKKKPKWNIEQFDVPPVEGETRFHDVKLPYNIMHSICDLGFKYCTPVQAQVLPHTLEGKDATARAQTGTGKSAAFLITIIAKLMGRPIHGKSQKGAPRALILAPTRELVIQIEKDAKALTKHNRLRTLAVFGGTGYKHQHDILENRYVDIVAATPGRLIDFMGQKVINLKKVEILVLDEADRMLDMGFLPDIRRIVYATPHKDKRQTMFFSATFTDEILRLASQWTREAVQIEVDPEHAASENIQQKVFIVTEDEKMPLLYNLVKGKNLDRVILFVNRRDTSRRVAKKLKQYDINNGVLSGEVAQNQRMRTLEDFKKGKLTVLVATDVAARGLHIEGVSHVINYDLPQEAEHYVHRIGRTGRAGAQGISVSFADEMSSFHIPAIEEVLGEKLECEFPDEELLKPLPPPKKLPEEEKGRGTARSSRGGRSGRRAPSNRKGGTPGKKGGGRPSGQRQSSGKNFNRRRPRSNTPKQGDKAPSTSREKSSSES